MHKIAIPQAAIDRVLKRRNSLHVFNDIDPARTAHIVVDLQNGFMAQGQPAEVPAARDIVPNVNRISAALRAAGGLVIYIQNTIDAAAKAFVISFTEALWVEARGSRLRVLCLSPGATGTEFYRDAVPAARAKWTGTVRLDRQALAIPKQRHGRRHHHCRASNGCPGSLARPSILKWG